MYLRAGYLSKLVDQEARDQLARLQLALEGSIFERRLAHCCWAMAMSSDDQLARLQLARSKSVHDCGVALQLARDQLARLQLARDQLARSGSAASDQLARLQLARL